MVNKKRTIYVKFVGFDLKDGKPLDFILFNNELIKSKYNIVESENPRYVFYQPFFDLKELSNYQDAIKIAIIGEPLHPDLNFFDYCFCFEKEPLHNRTCYFPHFLWDLPELKDISYDEALSIYDEKTNFCDFIYGHEIDGGKRRHYFDLLSEYKKVDSCGTYLNNQPDGFVAHYEMNNPTKFEFQKKCKFSLCIQWIDFPYFINEKIVHSFHSNEIPLFIGTEDVKSIFNPKRFIFIDDFESDSALLKRIKEIDNDKSLYCRIISQPIFNDPDFIEKTLYNAFEFLDHIFENDRIIRNISAGPIYYYLDQLSKCTSPKKHNSFINKVLKKIFGGFYNRSRNDF